MKILKTRRLNPALRSIFHIWSRMDRLVRGRMLQRLRYSGVADLELDGLNFKMYSECDDHIVDMLYFKMVDYAELSELKLFLALAKEAEVVLDVGANTGLYSVTTARVNPQAKLFAFEPYHINAQRLRKNLALNGLDKVQVLEQALGTTVGEIEFAVPEEEQICDVLSADTEFTQQFYRKWVSYKNVKVQATSLDRFVEEQNLQRLDLIKIDVENFESEVLLGALKTLEGHSPNILIEIFVDEEKQAFFEKHLAPLGYQPYSILSEGIVRTQTLSPNPDCRNFLLSKKKSAKEYLSFSEMKDLVEVLGD
jgi:FkbM family methyltransferase